MPLGKRGKFEDVYSTGIKSIILVQADNEEDIESFAGGRVYKDGCPKEFLQLLNACDFVCTDSFHGTVLSINFKKPFVEFIRFNDSNPNSQNSRVYDVLAHYGLMGQIYNKESDEWLGLYNESRAPEQGGGALHKSRSPFERRQGALPSLPNRCDRVLKKGSSDIDTFPTFCLFTTINSKRKNV